jgi:hypothetical protein
MAEVGDFIFVAKRNKISHVTGWESRVLLRRIEVKDREMMHSTSSISKHTGRKPHSPV